MMVLMLPLPMNLLSKIVWVTLKMVMFFLFLLSMIAQVTVTMQLSMFLSSLVWAMVMMGLLLMLCAISVDTSVIDDDDVGGGFVINDDICNGDGVGDDFSVNDVDMGVVDDDDIADVFVINEDMVEGDDVVDDFSVIGVYDCDKSVVFVVVVAVVQASV